MVLGCEVFEGCMVSTRIAGNVLRVKIMDGNGAGWTREVITRNRAAEFRRQLKTETSTEINQKHKSSYHRYKFASSSAFFIIHDNGVGDDESIIADGGTPGSEGGGVKGKEGGEEFGESW
ncbi:hypothetical protein TanjilG_25785 [Lupinus angustifolius]|uniref:Uncharacterized protein n=1 Tax=Lupinus angustifolius TaxID=3871 RepID=A0A1J7HGE5_LUPAN|nr:hypothetical protein TanjilG_25785 [Lupinus angustifolius]